MGRREEGKERGREFTNHVRDDTTPLRYKVNIYLNSAVPLVTVCFLLSEWPREFSFKNGC